MKRLMYLALFATPFLGLAVPAVAQEYKPPQMYFIMQEHVKPSMMAQYEADSKEFINMLAAAPNAASMEFTAISGPEIGYVFATPVDGFDGLAKTFQNWEKAMMAAGPEKLGALMEKAGKSVDHQTSFVLMLREDMSYLPETTALTAEHPLRIYHWWYLKPGAEFAVEAVAKAYVELYKKHKIESGFRVYSAVIGADLPMLLVVETADDMAQYHAREQAIQAKLGEEGKKLGEKAMSLARRLEISHGYVRPELSFPQPTSTSSK